MAKSIPIIGHCFPDVGQFLDYLESDVRFGSWRPRFVTVHHTGIPDLKIWNGWQTRAAPVTDEQWMRNLGVFYGSNMGWSSGPHFFVTPKNFCVLSPPDRRGVHAVSFNANSWGVECVGNFDREPFDGTIRDRLIEALAALHIAAGLQVDPYERGFCGLHFHRDDPKTNKTCPGTNVDKNALGYAVKMKMEDMTGGDEDEEVIDEAPPSPQARAAVVIGVPVGDWLYMRADASARSPVVGKLPNGQAIKVLGEAMNGPTRWLSIETPLGYRGWVAANYVKET